jgi:hypothetical protein
MKLETGIHPGRWHAGAWIFLAVLLALALVLSSRATGGGTAWAEPPPGASDSRLAPEPTTDQVPPVDENPAPPPSDFPPGAPAGRRATYVAEVVDSLFFVPPAGFLALDLPRDPAGARAVHLSGSVGVRGRSRDIMVRLFRSSEYGSWLHPGGASKGTPLWTSKRGHSHQLDLALPEGGPFVLLLDNGYSIRTPKHVSCQLQIEYRRSGAVAAQAGGRGAGDSTGAEPSGVYDESNPVTPRGNADSEIPPPPPPPPAGY